MFHINDLVNMCAITKAQAKFISSAVATESNRPVLCRAHLYEDGTLASTDGYQLHIVQCNPVYMPVLASEAGVVINDKKYGLDFLEQAYGEGCIGSYPDILSLKPNLNHYESVAVYASDLHNYAKQCSVIARDNANYMRLTLHEQGIKLFAKSKSKLPDPILELKRKAVQSASDEDYARVLDDYNDYITKPHSENNIECDVQYTEAGRYQIGVGTEVVSVGINCNYVLDMLNGANLKYTKKHDPDTIRIYVENEKRPIVMINETTNDYAIIMPMSVTRPNP